MEAQQRECLSWYQGTFQIIGHPLLFHTCNRKLYDQKEYKRMLESLQQLLNVQTTKLIIPSKDHYLFWDKYNSLAPGLRR